MKFYKEYQYSIIGGGVGACIAMGFFTIGFWKTILLLFLILIGGGAGFFIQRLGYINKIVKK